MTAPSTRGPGVTGARRPRHPVRAGLAWSFSRHKLLASCERAVFWQYFGWRGLGLEPGDPTAKRAFALKWLTALPLVIGTAVHSAARALLTAVATGAPRPSYDDLLVGARFMLNQVWRSSQPDLIDRVWASPAIHPALREVVYRGALREAEIEAARWRLRTCLANLCDAPLLDDLERALEEEGATAVRVGFNGPEAFIVDATAVWVALDLAYWHHEPSAHGHLVSSACWCIVDLKTGRANADDERLQLATYALWLEATGVPATDGVYLGRIVDLQHAADRWYVIGATEMDAARAIVAEDMQRQRARMVNADAGTPQPKRAWPMTTRRSTCMRCNFLELCRDEFPVAPERAPWPLPDEGAPLRPGAAS